MSALFIEPLRREPYALLSEPNWYRLGAEADGSCFFYCMLTAIDDSTRTMPSDKRTDYVVRVRKDISTNIDINTWKTLSHGLVAMLGVQELFLANCVNQLYRKPTDEKHLNQYIVCSKVLPYAYMEQTFIPSVYEEAYKHGSTANMLDTIRTGLVSKWTSYYDEPTVRDLFGAVSHVNPHVVEHKRTTVYDYIRQLLERIWDESVDTAFKRYIRDIAHPNVPVDTYIMGALGSYFKRNVIIIDHGTGNPYPCSNIQDRYDPSLPYIIILWINNAHFELLHRNDEPDAEYEFTHDDPMVFNLLDKLNINNE